MRTVWKVEESDIPRLYKLGLAGYIFKFPVDKKQYWVVNQIPNPASVLDKSTGLWYNVASQSDVDRYKGLYSQVKPDIEAAVQHANIIPVSRDETEILKNIASIQDPENLKKENDKQSAENAATLRQRGAQLFGESLGHVFDKVAEPMNKTTGLLEKTSTDVSDNLSKLTSSPFFLLSVVGVAAIVVMKKI